ncbi:Penicillin-binding protein 1A [Streptomyces sp. ADI97-07]|uniref:transglycosylase domain-containing protein n=1 Tax=Streptomyces sp. ADI97-07 TaxID=1522762 RepID=UPI000F559B20|nr:transglycosylase domain-containing protein [Streptomyces sp. ADI97-07]RPK77139.1 Penicillin-binding protein 1A [Streptomyces sp. ADI97-07]
MSHEPPQPGGDHGEPGQKGHGGWPPRNPTAAATTPNPQPSDGAHEPKGRTKRTKRPRRTGWRRAIPTWRMTLGGVLLLALLLGGGFLAGYQLVGIPAANASATAQSNVYLYADGSVIARDGEINRENIPLHRIPRTVQRAVLAAEDRDFYSEPAIDIKAMTRAGWNTLTGKGRQGGSTITQQYVKNYYLGQEQTVVRKAKEFFISIKLGREQSKDEILEGYLNTSYFGRNSYGIQAASHAYYGKNVEDLGTAEGAYLASLLNAPSAYDVVAHPGNRDAVLARWAYVLDGMVKEDWLGATDRAAMTFPLPGPVKPATALSGQRGYLVQAVEDYVTGHGIVDEKTLATGGYRITTTLQKKKQNALVEAVEDNVLSEISDDREADRNVRVGGASIDPSDGHVVAMYGGVDYTKQYVNNATRRDYQVGSTFKPFVLAAAVANGSTTQDDRAITPNTRYDGTNERTVQSSAGSTGYAPANEDDVDYGSLTVREATDKSVNAVYAQMAQDVGPTEVRDTAIALGIPRTTPDLTPSPSIALGPATASVVDMAAAYATLADHGRQRAYTLVTEVSKNGTALRLPARTTRRAISREAADTTTSVLRSVVDGGTGTAAQGAGRPAAGKTGTAEEDKAAWFAGYTPDLATVIAVMGQDPDTGVQKPLYGALGLARMNGGGPPARTWAAYTAAALESSEARDFELEAEEGPEEPDPDEETEESGAPRESGQPVEEDAEGADNAASRSSKAPGRRTEPASKSPGRRTEPVDTPETPAPGRTPPSDPAGRAPEPAVPGAPGRDRFENAPGENASWRDRFEDGGFIEGARGPGR